MMLLWCSDHLFKYERCATDDDLLSHEPDCRESDVLCNGVTAVSAPAVLTCAAVANTHTFVSLTDALNADGAHVLVAIEHSASR